MAERQKLSPKYLEQTLQVLAKNKLVVGAHGKGGGYRLNRTPDEYTVGEVLRLTEGDLAPVSCFNEGKKCSAAECRTMKLWHDFYKPTKDYFDHITIADLMNGERPDDYVI